MSLFFFFVQKKTNATNKQTTAIPVRKNKALIIFSIFFFEIEKQKKPKKKEKKMAIFPFADAKNIKSFVTYFWNGFPWVGTALVETHTSSFYNYNVPVVPTFALVYIAEKILDEVNTYVRLARRMAIDDMELLKELESRSGSTTRLVKIFRSFEKAFLNPRPNKMLNFRGLYKEIVEKLSSIGQLRVIWMAMRRLVESPSKRFEDKEILISFLLAMGSYFGFLEKSADDENDWDEILERYTDIAEKSKSSYLKAYKDFNERVEYADSPRFADISYRKKDYPQNLSGRIVNFETRDKNIGLIIYDILSGNESWPLLRYQIEEKKHSFPGLVKGGADMDYAWENIMSVIFLLLVSSEEKLPFVKLPNVMEFEFLLGLDRGGVNTPEFKRDMQLFYNVMYKYRKYVLRDCFEYLEKSYSFLKKDLSIDPVSFDVPLQNPFVNKMYVGIEGSDEFPPANANSASRIVSATVSADSTSGGASASASASDDDPSFFASYFC